MLYTTLFFGYAASTGKFINMRGGEQVDISAHVVFKEEAAQDCPAGYTPQEGAHVGTTHLYPPMEVSTAEGCAEDCNKAEGCNSFMYSSEGDTHCELYSGTISTSEISREGFVFCCKTCLQTIATRLNASTEEVTMIGPNQSIKKRLHSYCENTFEWKDFKDAVVEIQEKHEKLLKELKTKLSKVKVKQSKQTKPGLFLIKDWEEEVLDSVPSGGYKAAKEIEDEALSRLRQTIKNYKA